MRKVVQVLYSGLGGHGSVAFSLIAAARPEQAWLGRLVFVGIEPVIGEYEDVCRTQSIGHEYVQTIRGRAWQSWPALYRALRNAQPDAIILHSVKMILPCALYAVRHHVPLIAVEHQASSLKLRREWWVSRLALGLADVVVALTPDYREQLKARFGSRRIDSKVHVIANGIDTDAYSPIGAGSSNGQPVIIGMASRITGIKRHDLLIDAMAVLRNQGGRIDWRLSLAGDGDTLAALRAKVSELQLDDIVAFPGYLGENELKQWFNTLDIYAHASEGETLSTSILQALAMGLPIVGSDVAGISNLLAEGNRAGLVVAQTPEAFANAFRRIADEPGLADDMRRRARHLAVNKYSQARMFRSYDQLLERLCAK